MKKIVIIGTNSEANYIKRRINNQSMYSIIVINSVEKIAESILDMLNSDYIINAFIDGHDSMYAYKVLSSIELLKEKTIHFSKIANLLLPHLTVDRVMTNPNIDVYDCLVLGLSHAEVGIVPEDMQLRTANIAVSSQDIYYNFESLKYCVKKYYSKIRSISKVYIDMFDYTYFNYDTSLSSTVLNYYAVGGIFLPHNIKYNKNIGQIEFGDGLWTLIKEKLNEGITQQQINTWFELFGDIMLGSPDYIGNRNKPFLELRDRIFNSKSNTIKNAMNKGIIDKRHKVTIVENIKLFKQMLNYIFEINPKMEVKLIITPQHCVNSIDNNVVMMQWKKDFYSIIDELKKEYVISFKDYRIDEISYCDELFYDSEHLNYNGAKVFTKRLLGV